MTNAEAVEQGTPSASASEGIDITFDNRGDRLIGLGLVNGLLKIVSLGIYSFWAKTEVRKRLWSFTRLNGEPLEYTGTGGELLKGFLVVFVLFVLPLLFGGFAIAILFPNNAIAANVYVAAIYALIFFLIGNAMYRALRYRLSRTQWRGIRGGLTGSAWRYGWTYFWTLALPALLTLALAAFVTDWDGIKAAAELGSEAAGFIVMQSIKPLAVLIAGMAAIALLLPWRSNLLQSQLINTMSFGNSPLSYTGSAWPLYKNYLIAAVGGIILFAVASGASAMLFLSNTADAAPQDGPTGLDAGMEPGGRIGIAAIWFAFFIALAVITAWYRASQMNHFARYTTFGEARFRTLATGASLAWLTFSNFLIVFLMTVLGILLGVALLYGLLAATGTLSTENAFSTAAPMFQKGLIQIAILVPMIIATSVATTFAQFRSARYFLSRLKLDGPVDLAAIGQHAGSSPSRGEGLAQVFDIDAF